MVGGDVLPHRPQLADPDRIRAALEPLALLFGRADVSIANYETATGDPAPFPVHSLSLAATPAWMNQLRASGLRALTAANNHACDLGRRGLERTIAAGVENDLPLIGVADENPWRPVVLFEKDGRKLCAVAWTTFVNDERRPCVASGKLAVAPDGSPGDAVVHTAIASARRSCTAVLAIVHGGIEYEPPTAAMGHVARVAAEAGAIAVIAHHPHIVAAPRMVVTRDGRRVPFFPTLGNLVSNQGESWKPMYPAAQKDRRVVYMNGWTRLGMIADLSITLSDVPTVAFGHRLVWTENEHADDKQNPHPRIVARPLDLDADAEIVAKLARDAHGPADVFDGPCRLAGDTVPSCR
jgi:poly-gamma-glutamate synthesis protein (capsule biosynthesis protein)